MAEVFVGSEALGTGRVTRWELHRWYQPVFRGVYAERSDALSLKDRATAAWLASGRRGVIAGVDAAALHGARWVDDDHPIDMIARRARRQAGLIVRNETFAPDEITRAMGLPVTTRERTAFDLGRHLSRDQAVARIDALSRVREIEPDDVLLLAERYPGARGLKALRTALPLVDRGAASPQETRLRLLFIDAGLPRPTTQIPICDERGRLIRMVDMGWEEFKVVAEYRR
ncbi:hypothetical protein [Mycolicibacterium thermoresistibile]